MEQRPTGKVIIAGAGPGDPELITVKLLKRLEQAEVILTDRLVNPAILDKYAPSSALILMTGKQGYHDGSVRQEDINTLMVGHARNGKTVLRLKGGDVAFFSNMLDELICLEENRIPFEIIPGITAASGASAYTGIPLTARNHSNSVQFLTFHTCSHYSPAKWRSLFASPDTLVFYMAGKNFSSLLEILLNHNGGKDHPIAIIEQATTRHQQVHITSLQKAGKELSGIEIGSPSLVIMGSVVELYKKFNWYQGGRKGSVFPELVINGI